VAVPAHRLPPWRTVYGYFAAWRDDGTLARLHDRLRDQARAAAGRDPQPTAAVIDSQSVKAADTVPKASQGWDNAKKVNGRKRHIAVDTAGLVLAVVITAASVQDRGGARPLLWNLTRSCTRIRLAWADAGYTGKLTTWSSSLKITLEIVRKRDPHTFEVLPRRWVVERTLAWIASCRRCARDYERLPESHEAMVLPGVYRLLKMAKSTRSTKTRAPGRADQQDGADARRRAEKGQEEQVSQAGDHPPVAFIGEQPHVHAEPALFQRAGDAVNPAWQPAQHGKQRQKLVSGRLLHSGRR